MKELRFSIQCGASNRKALIARRCSQCTVDNGNIELDELGSHPQSMHSSHSNRSLSSGSVTYAAHFQTPKTRLTVERSSDTDKFDTLLMLAAERTSAPASRRKRQSSENHHRHHQRSARHQSTSPQRKDVPLLIVEQHHQQHHHQSHQRSPHVRFTTRTGTREIVPRFLVERSTFFLETSERNNLRLPHYDDDDLNAADISSGSTSSTHIRSHPRISRL
jgi:hypothetical protein